MHTIQAIFLNLLFKSVKSDPEVNRVKAFLKRILQICSAHAPPFICGCLFLISEVSFLETVIDHLRRVYNIFSKSIILIKHTLLAKISVCLPLCMTHIGVPEQTLGQLAYV